MSVGVDHEARARGAPEGHTGGAGEARTGNGHHGATNLVTRGRVEAGCDRRDGAVFERNGVGVARVVQNDHVGQAEFAGGAGHRDAGVADHGEGRARGAAEGDSGCPKEAGARDGHDGAADLRPEGGVDRDDGCSGREVLVGESVRVATGGVHYNHVNRANRVGGARDGDLGVAVDGEAGSRCGIGTIGVEGHSRGPEESGARNGDNGATRLSATRGVKGRSSRLDGEVLEVERVTVARGIHHHNVNITGVTGGAGHRDGRVAVHREARACDAVEGHSRGSREAGTSYRHHGAARLRPADGGEGGGIGGDGAVLERNGIGVARVVQNDDVGQAEVASRAGHRDRGVVDHRKRGARGTAEGHTGGSEEPGSGDGHDGAADLRPEGRVDRDDGCSGRDVLEVERFTVATERVEHNHVHGADGASRGGDGDLGVAVDREARAGSATEGHPGSAGEAGSRDGDNGASSLRPGSWVERGGDGLVREVLERQRGTVARGIHHHHVHHTGGAGRTRDGDRGVVHHGEARARRGAEVHTGGSEEAGSGDGHRGAPDFGATGRGEGGRDGLISGVLELERVTVARGIHHHHVHHTGRVRRSDDGDGGVADNRKRSADVVDGDRGGPEEAGARDGDQGAAVLRTRFGCERGGAGGEGDELEVERVGVAPIAVHHNHIDRAGRAGGSGDGDLGVTVDREAGAGNAAEGHPGGAGEAGARDGDHGAACFGSTDGVKRRGVGRHGTVLERHGIAVARGIHHNHINLAGSTGG